MASVQREFSLPEPLVEQLGAVTKRPTLEVVGERLFAVVKTVRWEAAEEEIRSGEVQLVLGEGFVVSVDLDAAVLKQVRQDLQTDPELVGAELAAVLSCIVDHAADSYGPVPRRAQQRRRRRRRGGLLPRPGSADRAHLPAVSPGA